MPDFKFGAQGINETYSSVSNYSALNSSTSAPLINVARVKKIILDDSDQEVFRQFGEVVQKRIDNMKSQIANQIELRETR